MPNLVGIGLSQVPTNSMLGGLAYQDPEHASIKDLDLKNLSQINSETSDTATDIFVYDTRKDSDGGAWRKRTQHTSWYNETLGTATRGTRKEFPAVAVIVAEQNFIKIYDGDDPDLPMWMVFNTIADGVSQGMADRPMVQVQGTDKIVYALNGILATGTKNEGSNYGQPIINFINEVVLRMDSQGGEGGRWMGNIAQRNEAIGYQSVDYDYVIAASRVNDIAMKVLPNAPIDETTGLPIPTIAVATDDGVSVIKDDGTVVDLRGNHGGSYNQSTFVDFDSKTNAIISGFDYGAANTDQIYKLAVFPIPSVDRNDDNNYTGYQHHYRRIQTQGNVTIPKLAGNYIKDAISAGGDGRYAIQTNASGSYPTALNIFQEEPGTDGSNTTYSSNSRVAYATTSYNTGWMHGDIKGAFLSDTDATNVSASTNLVTNGTFDSNNDSWNGSGISSLHNSFTTSQSSGYLIVNSNTNSGSYYGVSQNVTTTTGTEYMLSFDIVSGGTGNGAVRVADGNTATNVLSTTGGLGVGSYSFRFVSGSQSYSKVFLGRDASSNNGTNRTVYYDNIVVREVTEQDRSVNNKGLQVYGTITKQPVATGAELVSYSGWSSSNYLRQPYNSDLDFGTGDWCYMFWYNPNDAESGDVIFSRWSYNVDSVSAPRIQVYFNSGNLRVDTSDASAGTAYQGHFGSDGTQDSNEWHCAVILRRGPNLEIWIDGKNSKTGSLNSNSDGSYTKTNAIIEIGSSPGGGAAEAGLELALFRISASAPSPEQIKKMYEDEKHLFQENAKATLYGSSDYVKAIAYDDSNNVLHVGTSSGRSEFQGLRRINNTTEAVTTAISASNGLVAEQ